MAILKSIFYDTCNSLINQLFIHSKFRFADLSVEIRCKSRIHRSHLIIHSIGFFIGYQFFGYFSLWSCNSSNSRLFINTTLLCTVCELWLMSSHSELSVPRNWNRFLECRRNVMKQWHTLYILTYLLP